MMKLMFPLIIALFAPLCAQTVQDSARSSDRLTITLPSRDGVSAGCRVTVQGHLTLNPGEHALAFAARSDFANLGLTWMQGEVQIDSNDYSTQVTLGTAEDVGSTFRISIGIVDEATYTKLRDKFVEMMTTNHHLPIPFPQTVSAPRHRTVKKVSHEGC